MRRSLVHMFTSYQANHEWITPIYIIYACKVNAICMLCKTYCEKKAYFLSICKAIVKLCLQNRLQSRHKLKNF